MNNIVVQGGKNSYSTTSMDSNTIIIKEFINSINLNKHCITLKKHTREAINTIQYFLNVNGRLDDKIINNVALTLYYYGHLANLEFDPLKQFVKTIVYYANHTNHYFGGITKFNWGTINYTKSITNILIDLEAEKTYYVWSIEYMQTVSDIIVSNNLIDKSLFNKDTHFILRVARATINLDKIVTMYMDGLNFKIIGSFKDHDGFDGVMLGEYNSQYHLEFTHNKNLIEIFPEVHPEQALVFYCKNDENWMQQCNKMENAGFIVSKSVNPYWDKCGKTFIDCDGHRVILVNYKWNK